MSDVAGVDPRHVAGDRSADDLADVAGDRSAEQLLNDLAQLLDVAGDVEQLGQVVTVCV